MKSSILASDRIDNRTERFYSGFQVGRQSVLGEKLNKADMTRGGHFHSEKANIRHRHSRPLGCIS